MKNIISNLFKKKEPNSSSNIDPLKKKLIDFKSILEKFSKKLLGNKVKGEDVIGLEISCREIVLAQVSQGDENKWNLDKLYIHPIEGIPTDANIADYKDKITEQLKIVLEKSKLKTTNAAISIPVTSAIIRVVTSPLMTDEELNSAIQTDSLWENLVQLTDNLSDYSIFHQVVKRDDVANTMDILFVASKLSDVSTYTSIVENGGLNPVIVDVKCFSLKSAVDQINQISSGAEIENLTTVLEFGLDENYIMILYDNNPIITDIFIRNQDREILINANNQEDMEALVRRYLNQVKQAIQDFETKYEKRIRNVKVISRLPDIENYLGAFRKNLINTGFNLYDPIKDLSVESEIKTRINKDNKSYLTAVIGLAFRKLDVFGYYKFVAAARNINLLPDRAKIISEKKTKLFSNFAFKGLTGIIAIIFITLLSVSFFQINNLNKKISNYDKIVKEHSRFKKEKNRISNELGKIKTSLKLSKSIKSNKVSSFRVLSQVAASVPRGVKFDTLDYNGGKKLIIEGTSSNDQNILKLIRNLNDKKLISQATLSIMNSANSRQNNSNTKNFRINAKLVID